MNDISPLVSVAMASHNGEKFLREQLLSILVQDYGNIEVVVVDDASSDASPDLLRQFAASDARVKVWFSKERKGAVATFEEAIRHCRGGFVALSDQDDIFDPEKISTMVRCLRATGTDMVLSDMAVIDSAGRELAPSFNAYQGLSVEAGKPFAKLAYVNFATGCAMMVTRALLDFALPFPRNCLVHDWWLAVCAARSEGNGIALVPVPLTRYRQHGSNVIGAHADSFVAALDRAPDIDWRSGWYAGNSARISGYLERGTWSAENKAVLVSLEAMFARMADDRNAMLFRRLRDLPTRTRHALPHGMVHTLAVILFSLSPKGFDRMVAAARWFLGRMTKPARKPAISA